MSTKTALSEPDQQLLRLLASAESQLTPEIRDRDLARFGSIVAEIGALASRARHRRLTLRAHGLIALLSSEPSFPADMRDFTTRDPAFVIPLAAAARSGRPVSGPALGVWAGAQRPALAPGAWAQAERELKDLISLTAPSLMPACGRGPLHLAYHPLAKTNSLTRVTRSDLPAVIVKPVPAELRAAADDAARELGPYARTLESFEEPSWTVRAARLPRALFDLWITRPDGVRLSERIDALRERATVSMEDLLAELLPDVDSPDRRHISAVSELLQRFEIGLEPDPRFLAPLAHPSTPVTLFAWRVEGEKPSEAFVTASGLMHIGLAMAGADGHVDSAEIDHVRQRAMALIADNDERVRLSLRMDALASDPPDFDRLLLRLKGLGSAAKEDIADLLVSVASTDGNVSSLEYEALQRAYRAMRLGKPALDRTLEALRGQVRLADAVGADRDRRSQLGREQDAKRFDALHDLLLGTPTAASLDSAP